MKFSTKVFMGVKGNADPDRNLLENPSKFLLIALESFAIWDFSACQSYLAQYAQGYVQGANQKYFQPS